MKTTTPALRTWNLDPTHSSIQFAVRHMVISETRGVFNSFRLTLKNEGADFTGSAVELEIDVNSINTHLADRDNHLRSPDFFDAEKFPVIRFVADTFEKKDEENYLVKGNLTIREVTKPMEFNVSYGGQVVDPWGNLRAGFRLEGTINRFDFGLAWNSLLETGGAVVGKTVRFEAGIEMVAEAAGS